MDSDSGFFNQEPVIQIFEAKTPESSEEPPMEEWPSLQMLAEATNPKKNLYEQGLYEPGSGEICAKYFPQSDSSVLRHPYYRYPALIDPGILEALLKPAKEISYPNDGQELYVATCKEMNQCVVRSFHSGLLKNCIDLRYYGINPKGVRAMALALKYNTNVKVINFTDNFLNNDASYHLGDMLASNAHLVELNLSGCRIGPEGVLRLLSGMMSNRTLKILNLSKNEVGDEGMTYFADAVKNGLDVKEINLSHNSITGKGMAALVEPFQTYNKITCWNLSWNKLFLPGTSAFLNAVTDSTKNVTDMDLSWNSLCGSYVASAIKGLFTMQSLSHLDLSNNRLEDGDVKRIVGGLFKAKNLETLNLSYNPMSPLGALYVLEKLKLRTVKVNKVYLENITVNVQFINLLNEVKTIKPNLIILYGYIKGTFKPVGPDIRELIFNRIEYLCTKSKKAKVDFALLILQLKKDKVFSLMPKLLMKMLKAAGGPVDADLLEELCNSFPGPRTDKGDKTININTVVEYISRKWPDRKLPPTPPPEPEPVKPKRAAKAKGKSKK